VNILSFIAEMTKALAWPIAITILGLLFRSHLSGLLEGVKLRRLKKGEWLADFETVAQEIRADLSIQVPAEETEAAARLPEETEDLAEIAPAAAVSQVWNQLEERVAAVAARAGITQKHLPELLRSLVEKGVIQSSVRDSVLGLRNMRNLAVHAPPDRLTPKQAREFITMAEAIIWILEKNLGHSAVT
jgi:hypothetical protein